MQRAWLFVSLHLSLLDFSSNGHRFRRLIEGGGRPISCRMYFQSKPHTGYFKFRSRNSSISVDRRICRRGQWRCNLRSLFDSSTEWVPGMLLFYADFTPSNTQFLCFRTSALATFYFNGRGSTRTRLSSKPWRSCFPRIQQPNLVSSSTSACFIFRLKLLARHLLHWSCFLDLRWLTGQFRKDIQSTKALKEIETFIVILKMRFKEEDIISSGQASSGAKTKGKKRARANKLAETEGVYDNEEEGLLFKVCSSLSICCFMSSLGDGRSVRILSVSRPLRCWETE